MKILFLHIGDLHIKDKHGVNNFQIKKIIDSFNVFPRYDKVIIVITGDISHSGENAQYESAYHCVGQLISQIRRCNSAILSIEVLCVPGNHDLLIEPGHLTNKQLQEIRKKNNHELFLKEELNKQKNFFVFAKKNKCFINSGTFHRRIIKFDSLSVEANLINSAVFSSIEEDKGLHFIPQHDINELNTPSGADFVISIMHHAPDWYVDSQKNMLEAAIYGKSALVFFGHEHYIANKKISHEDNAPAYIQAGGCLCENDDWTKSSYHVGLLDTDTLEYAQNKFAWNADQKQYEKKENHVNILHNKPSIEKHLNILSNYINSLCEDKKHDISNDFRDYYVFPRIRAEAVNGISEREITKEEDFIHELLSRKKNLITGGYNSGKTTLLKSLFLNLSREYVVIFCGISHIRGKRVDRIIKNCFIEIYGENESDYNRFLQTPKSKCIIIIDDIDEIKSESFYDFVDQLDNLFEYFIFSSKQILDFSLFDRAKKFLKTTDLIYKYHITPLYADKRQALIEKVVTLKIDDPTSASKTVNHLMEEIKKQIRFMSLEPDFVIMFVEYYCKNISDLSSSDSGVFSKVFEASLTMAISKHCNRQISVDKIFLLLSKVAYFIHFNKIYPILESHIIDVIQAYNENYGTNVNYDDAIKIMTESKVLIFNEDIKGYRFANKNYLAYFVAREVNSQYNATNNSYDLQRILRCSCFGINSDILLFISYITDNISILRLILNIVDKYTKEWDEFNFGDKMPAFLKSERKHNVGPPPADARESEKKAEIEAERVISNELETIDIYDYAEDDAEKFFNQIMRACSLLVVIAKCLPHFEHNMLKADKDAFVEVIYRLPNKIFQLWAVEADKNIDDLLRFFKEQSQDYYSRHRELSDDDIIRALQQAGISLLLDLYNLSAFYSTKDNTLQYLEKFSYRRNDTYALEYLMMLERQNASIAFVQEAIDMDSRKSKSGHIFSTSLRWIVNHALVFMDGIDLRLSDRLKTTFFPQRDDQKKLLVAKLKKLNRDN